MKLKISCENNEKNIQKQSPDKMAKWYPENMQQIYRRTPKSAIQIYENHTYAWMFSCKFTACLQNTSGGLLLNIEKYPRTLEIYG